LQLTIEPLFKLEIYSHFFKILNPKDSVKGLILKYCSRFVLMTYVKERGKKPTLQPTKVFATRISDGSEFRFHIGQLNDFLKLLEYNFILPDQFETEIIPLYTPVRIKVKVKPGWTLYDYQEEVKSFILLDEANDNKSRLVALPTGTGKEQPLDALIKIPSGWTTMGKLKLNDTIIAKDGSHTKVIGIYPNGVKNIYKITFRDGRSAECGLDHLWKVYCEDWETGPKILSTKHLLSLNSCIERKRVYIDLIDPEDIPDIDLLVDPYILGVLLGDGIVSNQGIIDFCSLDDFIIDEVKRLLPSSLSVKKKRYCRYGIVSEVPTHNSNIFLTELRKLKVMGTYSYNKKIPDLYMNGSISQKISLLQGLLDTDGYAGIYKNVQFHTVSNKLAEQVQYIVRSLGGLCSIKLKQAGYKKLGIYKRCRDVYALTIRFSKPKQLFRLPRKKERLNEFHTRDLKLRIESIELIGQKEAQCIMIDHPDHLYITNEFIPTHNTFVTLATVADIQYRTAIIVLPAYIEKFAKDIVTITDTKSKEIMTIQGADQLKSVIHLASENQFNSKFIIISLRTIQSFFKAYEQSAGDFESEGYGCRPDDLYKLLGIGTVIIDEIHQHLHAVYKLTAYMHVPKLIGLSATFISEDPVINAVQRLMFPREIRYDKVRMKQYIKVRAMSYSFNDFKNSKIRTTQYGSNVYSHMEFEKSLIRNKHVLNNYIKLINSLVHLSYFDDYIKGDKLIIFAASIAMCDILVNYLKSQYPKYDIRRYVEEDPYENIIDADIRITTILSGGTAVDIPNLRAAIMTTSIQSPVSNLQTLGRLRELKDRDVKFYYIYSDQIPKQVEYHRKKMELFRDRVETIKEFHSPIMV